MNEYVVPKREACPECGQPVPIWKERAQFGSREIYWVGCGGDGHFAGGNTHAAAVQNWNRFAVRWKFDHQKGARA